MRFPTAHGHGQGVTALLTSLQGFIVVSIAVGVVFLLTLSWDFSVSHNRASIAPALRSIDRLQLSREESERNGEASAGVCSVNEADEASCSRPSGQEHPTAVVRRRTNGGASQQGTQGRSGGAGGSSSQARGGSVIQPKCPLPARKGKQKSTKGFMDRRDNGASSSSPVQDEENFFHHTRRSGVVKKEEAIHEPTPGPSTSTNGSVGVEVKEEEAIHEPTPEPIHEPTPEPIHEPTPGPSTSTNGSVRVEVKEEEAIHEPTPEPIHEPTPGPRTSTNGSVGVEVKEEEAIHESTPEPIHEPTPGPSTSTNCSVGVEVKEEEAIHVPTPEPIHEPTPWPSTSTNGSVGVEVNAVEPRVEFPGRIWCTSGIWGSPRQNDSTRPLHARLLSRFRPLYSRMGNYTNFLGAAAGHARIDQLQRHESCPPDSSWKLLEDNIIRHLLD